MINCTGCSALIEKPKKGRKCKCCINMRQRKVRKLKNNEITKRYEKTKKGYLVRTYRNMLSRVTGILKNKAHLYKGLCILKKEDFYDFSLKNEVFNSLFDNYQKNCFDLKLAPSIDRIDSNKGHLIENIRWVTFSENSRTGALSQKRRKNENQQ